MILKPSQTPTNSAGAAENWDATQYTYAYDGHHNAPEKARDEKIPGPLVRIRTQTGPPVRLMQAIVSADQRSVRLRIEGCQLRRVIPAHERGRYRREELDQPLGRGFKPDLVSRREEDCLPTPCCV